MSTVASAACLSREPVAFAEVEPVAAVGRVLAAAASDVGDPDRRRRRRGQLEDRLRRRRQLGAVVSPGAVAAVGEPERHLELETRSCGAPPRRC